ERVKLCRLFRNAESVELNSVVGSSDLGTSNIQHPTPNIQWVCTAVHAGSETSAPIFANVAQRLQKLVAGVVLAALLVMPTFLFAQARDVDDLDKGGSEARLPVEANAARGNPALP